jgi:hypothetical protein
MAALAAVGASVVSAITVVDAAIAVYCPQYGG